MLAPIKSTPGEDNIDVDFDVSDGSDEEGDEMPAVAASVGVVPTAEAAVTDDDDEEEGFSK